MSPEMLDRLAEANPEIWLEVTGLPSFWWDRFDTQAWRKAKRQWKKHVERALAAAQA